MTRKNHGSPRSQARWHVVDCARMVIAAYNIPDGDRLGFALDKLAAALIAYDEANETMVAERMSARGQRLLERDFSHEHR